MYNIVFKFIYFTNYPTSFTTSIKTETASFKPVYDFLQNSNANNVEIYANDELTWLISKYGNVCYVTRFLNGVIFARYTIKNGLKNGYVYIYAQDLLKYILHYDNNNLHGKQLIMSSGTVCFAQHGKVNDQNVEDVHKIATDLLKWV